MNWGDTGPRLRMRIQDINMKEEGCMYELQEKDGDKPNSMYVPRNLCYTCIICYQSLQILM